MKPVGIGRSSTCCTPAGWSAAGTWWDSLSGGQLGYVHAEGHERRTASAWCTRRRLGRYHDRRAWWWTRASTAADWPTDDLATFLNGEEYMYLEPARAKLGSKPELKWKQPSVVVMSEGQLQLVHVPTPPTARWARQAGGHAGGQQWGTAVVGGLQNGMWFGIPRWASATSGGVFLENQQLEPDSGQPLDTGVVSWAAAVGGGSEGAAGE